MEMAKVIILQICVMVLCVSSAFGADGNAVDPELLEYYNQLRKLTIKSRNRNIHPKWFVILRSPLVKFLLWNTTGIVTIPRIIYVILSYFMAPFLIIFDIINGLHLYWGLYIVLFSIIILIEIITEIIKDELTKRNKKK